MSVNLLHCGYSERDNFEAELKELTRRFETLDLTHTALTRERNTLSKEVLHTQPNTQTLACTHNILKSFWVKCAL